MSTKKELEARIEELEIKLREQSKALRELSPDDFMEVRLPWRDYVTSTGDAPSTGRENSLQKAICGIVSEAIKKHGIPYEKTGYIPSCGMLRLGDGCHCDPDDFILPKIWGEIMIEFLDAAARFGQECYAKGHKDGSNLLGKLADGSITVDGFEKDKERSDSVRSQPHKTFRSRLLSV